MQLFRGPLRKKSPTFFYIANLKFKTDFVQLFMTQISFDFIARKMELSLHESLWYIALEFFIFPDK